ncbi:hypothetical protein ASZ87_00005 [Vibrio cholerae]|nr:hypothetical protein ASZ87_00005 [Vibrio cholerae]
MVKVQDRDEALEIIEELSAKHRQEKQALQSEVTKLTQEKQSNERLLADKDKRLMTYLRNSIRRFHQHKRARKKKNSTASYSIN